MESELFSRKLIGRNKLKTAKSVQQIDELDWHQYHMHTMGTFSSSIEYKLKFLVVVVPWKYIGFFSADISRKTCKKLEKKNILPGNVTTFVACKYFGWFESLVD